LKTSQSRNTKKHVSMIECTYFKISTVPMAV
jgi:hypothetical protein